MSSWYSCLPPRNHQRGVVLIVALLLLVLMALVTFSTYNGTVLEERMAGNASNRNQAFQAAEMTLRGAERVLDPNWASADLPCTPPTGSAGYFATEESPTTPGMQDSAWWSANLTNSADGSVLPGWSAVSGVTQIRYAIENLGIKNVPTPMPVYRITVRAVGDGGRTVVVLESNYRCK